MKRKFKLITSVASLCLAVALMAFGVYAATAPSVTVNGSVSFAASNVLASWKVEQHAAAAAIAEGNYKAKADVTCEGKFETTTKDTDAEAKPSVTLDELKLDDVNLTASYRMTITSDFDASSNATVKVKLTAPADVNANGITETTVVTINGAAATKDGEFYVLEGGQVLVVTYTITVEPAVASSFTANARNFKLELSRGAKA